MHVYVFFLFKNIVIRKEILLEHRNGKPVHVRKILRIKFECTSVGICFYKGTHPRYKKILFYILFSLRI